jgi:DNA-binding response OmpR family regulator
MRRSGDDRPRGIGPQHVLVVEDDESISKLLKIVLEQNGYRVNHVGTYASAFAAIQDSEPSLVLLDLGLPDGNGLDLLKWIRDEAGMSVPVVVLSAFRQDENVQKAFELGANDFMSKPFRPKELIQRLQRVIEG